MSRGDEITTKDFFLKKLDKFKYYLYIRRVMNSLLKVRIIDMLFNLLLSDRLGTDEVDQINDIIVKVRGLKV